jgi:hypothetical protein
VFNGANETLTLAASTHGVVAATSAPKGGLEQNFLSLADELGPNRWVSYSAVNQRCVAVPTGSTITPGNNVNNNSTITVSFEVDCSFLVPLTPPAGLDLLSIVDAAEVKIAGATRTLNDASRVAFLPGQGQLTVKGITVFSLSYDVLVGPGPSGNATLGDVTYSDCSAGSLRVELTLNTSTGAPAGTAKVYLGSNTADHGQSGCNGFESIGTDLVNNPAARVDTSGLAGNLSSSCCITFKQFQTGPTGKLVVQKAVFINDHGSLPLTTFANHRVTFFDGNVNGVTALSSLQVVSPTGFRQVSDLPTSGVSMTVRKLTLNQVPIADPPVVKILLDSCTPTPPATTCDPDIEINGHQYRAHFNINSIQPDSSGGLFSIDLCPFGAEEVDPSVTATTPRGMCIPNQAILTLL